MNATQYAQTIRVIDVSTDRFYSKSKAMATKLRNLLGYEQAREIVANCINRSFVGGYLSYATLLKELQHEHNLKYALAHKCACGNCQFIRNEYIWINSQKARLELDEMSERMRVSVQADIDFETNRMNKVILEGCAVK